MIPTDPITDKVKKLLRLSKSPNRAEADAALAKALELADKHQLDMAALADDDDVAKLVTQYFRCGGSRLAREWSHALFVAREFFHVTTCVMQGRAQVAFIGTAADIQIADYVAAFLVRRCRAEMSAFFAAEKSRGRRKTANKKASFIDCYFGGIHAQLKRQRQTQAASVTGFELVLSKAKEARQAHLRATFGPTEKMNALSAPKHTGRTMLAGFNAGLNTQINPAIGTDAPLALTYTP